MRIGLNCLGIYPSYRGGINSFTLGLLSGLVKNAGNSHKIQVYTTSFNAGFFKDFEREPAVEIIVFPENYLVRRLRLFLSLTWAKLGLKKQHLLFTDKLHRSWARVMDQNSDIIYTSTTILFPYSFKKPTLTSMHDIQHVHYPEFFSRELLNIREVQFGLTAEKTSYLQASSNFIKDDLLAHFSNLRPDQIVVIPEGVNIAEFSRAGDENVCSEFGLPERFIFFPAQLWPHKNHITVLKALKKIRDENKLVVPLVMTGEDFGEGERIFNYIKTNKMENVFYLGKVSFKHIVDLYHRARFFITGVLYESSSIPFLEAAASGCPIIASNTPPNIEMAQKLRASLFKMLDSDELASLISRIWEDQQLIEDHVSFNKKAILYYDWENIAGMYLNFLQERIPV